MTRLTRRAAALLGGSLILAVLTACGDGTHPKLTESAAPPPAAPATAASSGALIPEGTYRTPKLTREQMIAAAVKRGFTRTQATQVLPKDRINRTATFTLTLQGGQWTQSYDYDGTLSGVGFQATYKVIDHGTVVVTEPAGDETAFEYALVGDSIQIRFKDADPVRMCQIDARCPAGIMVWESAPFSRV
jgi:hypothetical protein